MQNETLLLNTYWGTEVLVLARKEGERIIIGDCLIVITVCEVRKIKGRSFVRLEIEVDPKIRRCPIRQERVISCGENFIVGDSRIRVCLVRVSSGRQARIGIIAPNRDLKVHREEIYAKIQRA